MPNKNYLIGQRVIYSNAICTICAPEKDTPPTDWIWLYNPIREYKHAVAEHNIKPLPNGQL